MREPIKCSICDSEDWHNLDNLRDPKYWYNQNMIELHNDYKTDPGQFDVDVRDGKVRFNPIGFKVCKSCGYLTYDYPENIEDQYDKQRDFIRVMNIVTNNRKIRKHEKFLKEIFDELSPSQNGRGFSSKVLDVGCAQGTFLKYIKDRCNLDNSNVFGTEFSSAAREFGKNYYGLNIVKDISQVDKSERFDLISYYHVIEHVEHPDRELLRIRNYLKKDGYLYMSIPHWCERLEEASGAICDSFENLYHLNHINCFTFHSFENLIKKCGFEIVKSDDQMYGYTVLCKMVDIPEKFKPIQENYKEIIKSLKSQKEAINMFVQKKYDEALKVYKNFPDAYIMKSIDQRNNKSFEMQDQILVEGLKNCRDSLKIREQRAAIRMQWDGNVEGEFGVYTNRVKEAEHILTALLEEHPSEQYYFSLAVIEGKYKKDYGKAIKYLEEVIEINPMRIGECMNMVGQFYSRGTT